MGDEQPTAPGDASPEHSEGDDGGRVPAMQSLLDNPFLLLFIGVATPAAFYIIWGVMEIAQIPIAP